MPDDNTSSSSDRLETAARRLLAVVGELEAELHRLVETVEDQRTRLKAAEARIAELEADLNRLNPMRQSGGR